MSTAVSPFDSKAAPIVQFQTLDSNRGAYLSFPMPRSGIWPDVLSVYKDLREFEPIIKKADDTFVRVADAANVFSAFLVTGSQFYTDMDEKGVVHRSRASDPNDNAFIEHWETILAVLAPRPDGETDLIPVKAAFRKAMVGAVRRMVREYMHCQTDEWAKVPAHAKACKVMPVWARVCSRIRVTKEQGKKWAYPEATAVCEAIGQSQAKILAEAYKTPSFEKECNAVLRAYDMRVAEIKTVLNK